MPRKLPVIAGWLLLALAVPSVPAPPGQDESRGPSGAPSPALSGGDAAAFLDAWAAKWKEIRSLAMTFRQEKRLRILRRPRVSEGELVYAGGKLRLTVRGRDGEVESDLLLGDGRLKILYPRLKRLEVIEVGAGSGPPGATGKPGGGASIPFFAGDPREMTRDYTLVVSREGSKHTVRLTPKDAKSPVKRLELVLEDYQLREYRQLDANGDELHLEILKCETNPAVKDDRFELKVPEGTTGTRPVGGKGSAKAKGG